MANAILMHLLLPTQNFELRRRRFDFKAICGSAGWLFAVRAKFIGVMDNKYVEMADVSITDTLITTNQLKNPKPSYKLVLHSLHHPQLS